MALKDWKKVNNFVWMKNDESKAIVMSQKGFEDKFTFSLSLKKPNGHYLVSSKSLFPYSSREVALKRANDYMRGH